MVVASFLLYDAYLPVHATACLVLALVLPAVTETFRRYDISQTPSKMLKEKPMRATTRTTLSDDAREILTELGISVISDDARGRFPCPGGYVALGDAEAGPYEGHFPISAVEAACEAAADPYRFEDDEDGSAMSHRFEAFHDALQT